MKFIYIFSLLFCTSALIQAQNVLQEINIEVQNNSRAYATLKESGETIGHRLTGSENGKKAEEYAFNLLKSYGFADVRYEEFEVEAWSRNSVSMGIAAVGTKNYQALTTVSLAHSPKKANVEAEIIDVRSGLEVNFEAVKDEVKGKIALVYIGILEGDTGKNLHRSEKTALAIRYGAKGIIIINQVSGRVLLTGTASVTGKLIPIPAVCIAQEDGLALKERLKTEKLKAKIGMKNFSKIIKARNVVATIQGTELAQEKIILGGHLDSWDLATGALDNGIGSFAILDIARTFKKLALKTRRTIEFVMFMGEEQGLLGSKAMIKQREKNNELDAIKYMINLDMTGNPIGFNAATESSTAEDFFTTIGAKMQAVDSAFANHFGSRAGLHSDHQPFMLQGIPTLNFQGKLDTYVYRCYHASCDDIKLVNEKHLKNTVRFVSMALFEMANADQLPAKRLSSEETKQFLIKQGLKDELIIGGDWKWKN